ncbi:hypothetical protein NEOLEDRAFT_1056907 [Neolentinus lepideus HHB14362 ss-1]|uniref:cAMP-independent regulatory protein pac2 n=1 Tax=Neolentinus lepideus HHB14362 ss-1 TaxID=1314782 RepID=A0A165V543_9AGAM|nr:hypothetical protein NEOLEDRAFT_1056907 [Neolentinus lepideus HHB14362 ss-1]
MQRPTCTNIRLRATADAHVIFHAVNLGVLPMVLRRLDSEERRSIVPGSVFVWEERSPNTEATGLGIERWTDGIKWGPSRVRDDFLLYNEKDVDYDLDMCSEADRSQSPSGRTWGNPADHLVKQTYSVFVETPRGRRKWHMIAYFTQESLDYLRTIQDIPELARLQVPEGLYKKARLAKGRGRESEYSYDRQVTNVEDYGSHSGYPYTPYASHLAPSSPYMTGTPERQKVKTPDWRDSTDSSQSVARGPDTYLAPLSYLESIRQSRRHPLDEKALRSFRSR